MHFQLAAPAGLDYAVNRYRREAERHYQVVEDHLADRTFIVGNTYTIADMSLPAWIDRASRVLKGEADPFAAYPNIKKWFGAIDARPAAARARAVGTTTTLSKNEMKKRYEHCSPLTIPLSRSGSKPYQTVDGACCGARQHMLEV